MEPKNSSPPILGYFPANRLKKAELAASGNNRMLLKVYAKQDRPAFGAFTNGLRKE